jgi:serine/threonine-protein kinase
MIGRVLGGRYTVIEMVDSGGMAYIYKALCKKTGSFVAVKVLKEKFSNSTEYVNRFKKEAAAAFSLDHDGIVHVTDIGCDNGVYYMVMEFVEGRTLKSIIDAERVIEEKDAIGYAIQICAALSSAHKRGIIHRDIKPQNILIDPDNRAKVTDFGIAKSLSARHEDDSQVIGSVYYISPEQARGESVDTRTDIYSLGIMLYEMTTGELPYVGDQTVSVALKHINEQITEPAQKNPILSESINKIILKATSKNKKDRYRTMDAFRDDLVRAMVDPSGEYVDLPNHRSVISAGFLVSPRKLKIWKICVLAALIIGLGVAAGFAINAFNAAAEQATTVPNTAGMDMDAATGMLKSMGLQAAPEFESSETIAMGTVISQSPLAGNQARKGDIVTLKVSSGPSDLLMPDVYDMALEDAQAAIEQMGLVVESVTYENVSDVATGHILAQSPESGSVVYDGDAVSLVVAGESVPSGLMPSLTGNLLSQAIPLLYDNGFNTCYVYEQESELPEGTVTAQSPEQGIMTPFANEISLWVSAYKNKTYTGRLTASIDITESNSIMRIIVEDTLDGRLVDFVEEMQPDVGMYNLDYTVHCMTSGQKTVRVLLNNAEVLNSAVEVG